MGRVTSKLDNVRLLRQYPSIAPHIPVTHSLTQASLSKMIHQFPSVYLKPDNSCQGKGLLRVDRLSGGRFLLRSRDYKRSWTLHHSSEVWNMVQRVKMDRPYLIQRGIESITANGHLFDIRTHLMRLGGQWQITGMVARMTPSQNIATNTYSGGTSHFLERLLVEKARVNRWEVPYLMHELDQLSLRTVDIVSDHYPRWSEFGLDIGMDRNKHFWIYEVNIKPGGLVFKNLDKSAHQRLMALRKYAS